MIVTNTLTSVEGHVLRLGGVLRTRKIFVGCPAIRPFWDQSTGRYALRFQRLLVTGSIQYTVKLASAASQQRRKIQDRSRVKDRTKYRPGLFTRLSSIPSPSMGEG